MNFRSKRKSNHIEWDSEDMHDAAQAACDHQNYGGGISINTDFLKKHFWTREEKYIKTVKSMTYSERCMEWERIKNRPLLSKWFYAWAKTCRSAALKQKVFGKRINFEF